MDGAALDLVGDQAGAQEDGDEQPEEPGGAQADVDEHLSSAPG